MDLNARVGTACTRKEMLRGKGGKGGEEARTA